MVRVRDLFVPVLGVGVALGFASAAQAGPVGGADCTAVITKIARPGNVTLRNSSTNGAQTGGSVSNKSVTVVVSLDDGPGGACDGNRDITVVLTVTDVDGDPVSISPGSPGGLTKTDVSGGRFKFTMTNDSNSCADDAGPVPKDVGGVNEVNVDGLTYNATATNTDAGGTDPAPNGSSFGPVNSDLTCKPSRTSL